MKYKKYQHVDRLGRQDCEGVLNGKVYIQPKIDGTNSVVYLGEDEQLHCGSRTRELTIEDDNRGFCKTILENGKGLLAYLKKYPNRLIYGEWLVPHTIRYYHPDAWNKFYIFDIYTVDDYTEDGTPIGHYENIEDYHDELDEYIKDNPVIEQIPLLAILVNPTQNEIANLLKQNKYLLPEDSDKIGEGVVIKNYNYRNKYGHIVWGKIVAEEFFGTKEKLRSKNHDAKSCEFEKRIANSYITETAIRKEFAKVLEMCGIDSAKNITREQRGKVIGMTLQFVYDAFLHDDLITVVKKNKTCVIDFAQMKHCSDNRVKEVLENELF